MTHHIIRLSAVKIYTGLSRSTIYRYVSMGLFPRPIRLGKRTIGWLENEVNEWIQQQVEATRGNQKNT